MSHYTIKNPDNITLNTTEFDINVTTLKLTNAPTTNNANTKIISRNSATGVVELSDKSTLAGAITMQNPSVTVGRQDILINPGLNVALPGPFNFKSIVAGSGITLTPGANDLTISATVPGTSSITVNNIGSGGGTIATPGGTIALPGTLQLKSLTAGTGIALTNGANTITITSTATGNNIYNSDGTIPNVLRTATLSNGTTLRFHGVAVGAADVIFDNLGSFTTTVDQTITLEAGNTINIGVNSATALKVNIGNKANVLSDVDIAADGRILLDSTNIFMPSITDSLTNFFLTYNTLGGGPVHYHPINNYYGAIRYRAQSPSVSSTLPTQAVGITGTMISIPSANVGLAGTNDGILFTGVSKEFFVTFTCSLLPATGSQDFSIGIFKNGVLQANDISTGFASTGSLNLTITTQINLNTNDILRVGFARSTTTTGITFSGNLYIKSIST